MNEIEYEMVDQSTTTKMLLDLIGQDVKLILLTDGTEMVQEGELKKHQDDAFAVEFDITHGDTQSTTRSLIFMADDILSIGKRNGVAIIIAIR